MRLPGQIGALVVGLLVAAGPIASGQTQSAPASGRTDIYHVHFTKAAPGQAAALGKELIQPDSTQPMPDHFVVLRHQEGDDWDYAVIYHLGQKATVNLLPPGPNPSRQMRAWHADNFVSGPSWTEFTREMGIGGSAKPGAIYVLGVHRPAPGQGDQLDKSLSAPGPADAKIQTGNLVFQHIEGGPWQFLTITRYNSWQDFGAERAAAQAAAASQPGGWADVRQYSAFHRDTIADRIHPK